MKEKIQLENLMFELKRLENEYYNLNKKTFLAVLYYNSTIRSLKKKISHLKKELDKENYN